AGTAQEPGCQLDRVFERRGFVDSRDGDLGLDGPALEAVEPPPSRGPAPERRIRKIGHIPDSYSHRARIAGDGGPPRIYRFGVGRRRVRDRQGELFIVRTGPSGIP